jgi:phosphatidate cytidylyltransferase/phytol kinase
VSDLTSGAVWLGLVGVSAGYGLLFGCAELLRGRGLGAETTRKLVHVGSGLLALALPLVFDSAWPVVALALAFTLVLLLSARLGRLGAIHAIERRSLGAFLYPSAIALTFLRAHQDLPLYAVAILALAFGDAAAALVGQRLGYHRTSIWGQVRSLEGSLAALLVAGGLTVACLALAGWGFLAATVVGLLVGLLVALAEAASPRGTDNLTVPLAALAALQAESLPLESVLLVGAAMALLMLGLLQPTRGVRAAWESFHGR